MRAVTMMNVGGWAPIRATQCRWTCWLFGVGGGRVLATVASYRPSCVALTWWP